MSRQSKASSSPLSALSRRGRITAALGSGWQRLVCGLANLRRRLLYRRLPDYVVFTVDSELAERDPDIPWPLSLLPLYHRPVTLEALYQALGRVAADPDVKGVIFLFKGGALSLARAQSLATLFARFRSWCQESPGQRTKSIVVYIEQNSAPVYVTACSADKVICAPLTEWDVIGLRVEPLFLKDTLAQLGISFEVVRVAPWKTAADNLIFNEMSDAAREQYNWLLDSLYGDIVEAISQGRGLSAERVRDLVDKAPLTAAEALDARLVDQVAYEDELPSLLGTEARPARLKRYGQARALLYRQPQPRTPQAIGVINLRGTIMPGRSRSLPVPLPLLGEATIGSTTAQQLIRQARKDNGLAGVVVYVDSPGGSALASDLIWRELKLLDQEKPVIIYMGDVAASGGYYIAAPGRRIVAQRATLTGSIGVIAAKLNAGAAYAKLHAHRDQVERGAHAGIYSDTTTWDGEIRARVESTLFHVYDEFKQRVAAGRGLAVEAVEAIAGGRVWTGAQAVEHRLVDALGDLQTAVDLACTEAGLPAGRRTAVVNVRPPGRTLLATPVNAARAVLGLEPAPPLHELSQVVRDGQLIQQLVREQVWLLAIGLPRI
ncbi:MAG: signal peptide peptidase SppA [Caldilineaceae bacterium]|nr:signal peptide peptidase SppA [Caldilineaceae bacterium]